MGQWDEQSPGPNGHATGEEHAGMELDTQAQIQQAIENAREEIDHYVGAAADFIRERPVICVAGAVAIGFLIGKLASRR